MMNISIRSKIVNLLLVLLMFSLVTSVVYADPIDNNLPIDELMLINQSNTEIGHSLNPSQESRIETFTIRMPQLGDRQRTIQVYLPLDYDSSDKAYPVFYLHDGENLFNPPPESIGDYRVDETLDRLISEGLIEGVIVVGIEHDRDNEWDEYIPWVNTNMHDWVHRTNANPEEGGDGFAFIDFVVNTLKPEIDSRYRTLPDRENTAIGGFCRGGLFPIVAGIVYPDVFSKVMAMSPAVWMAEDGGAWLSNNHLINFIYDQPMPENVKFYVDIGTEEASGPRPPVKNQAGQRITYPQAYVEGASALVDALRSNGVPEENLYFGIFTGVKGTRDVWAVRLDEVFLWFFNETVTEKPLTPTAPLKVEPTPDDPLSEESQEDQIQLPIVQTPEEVGISTRTILILGILCAGGLIILILLVFLIIRLKKRK
jgi:predicted alpha/beta superfamily hydrolase